MIKRIVLGQLRHLLGSGSTGLAAWLVANGSDPQEVEVMISGFIALVSFLWSAWDKFQEDKKQKLEKAIVQQETKDLLIKEFQQREDI